MKIEFHPLREEHLPLFQAWLGEPHVAEFWQESGDTNELREKFLSRLPSRGYFPFVIVLDGRPVGYIQHYEACRAGGGWWPDEAPGVFGIDQLLGEPGLVGRGIGSLVIRCFLDQLFANPAVAEVITDPEPGNGRAIRAYEKAGFRPAGELETPNGRALLMRIKREEWARR